MDFELSSECVGEYKLVYTSLYSTMFCDFVTRGERRQDVVVPGTVVEKHSHGVAVCQKPFRSDTSARWRCWKDFRSPEWRGV